MQSGANEQGHSNQVKNMDPKTYENLNNMVAPTTTVGDNRMPNTTQATHNLLEADTMGPKEISQEKPPHVPMALHNADQVSSTAGEPHESNQIGQVIADGTSHSKETDKHGTNKSKNFDPPMELNGKQVVTFNKFSALEERDEGLVGHSDQEQEDEMDDLGTSKLDGEVVTGKIKSNAKRTISPSDRMTRSVVKQSSKSTSLQYVVSYGTFGGFISETLYDFFKNSKRLL